MTIVAPIRSGELVEAEVKIHPDARTFSDEWSGITDPVLRRKLQNRLNQRAARKSSLRLLVVLTEAGHKVAARLLAPKRIRILLRATAPREIQIHQRGNLSQSGRRMVVYCNR